MDERRLLVRRCYGSKNKLNIKDADELERAESDITYVKLADIDRAVSSDVFDYQRLLAIHKYIFGDIYEWAGTARVIGIVNASYKKYPLA